ncbi:hypothetical protein MMC07_006689 [Pseudocyphellaria aurata]|nr:hypothetical protein [Pseudocyphellaria aurata]
MATSLIPLNALVREVKPLVGLDPNDARNTNTWRRFLDLSKKVYEEAGFDLNKPLTLLNDETVSSILNIALAQYRLSPIFPPTVSEQIIINAFFWRFGHLHAAARKIRGPGEIAASGTRNQTGDETDYRLPPFQQFASFSR